MAETTITAAELGKILTEALAAQAAENRLQMIELIKEMKKPTELEQKKIDEQAELQRKKQESRKKNAANVKLEMKNKIEQQKYCTHEHEDGKTAAVFIQDGFYMICQHCFGKVRPGPAPDGYRGADQYDTALFNKMLQKYNRQGS